MFVWVFFFYLRLKNSKPFCDHTKLLMEYKRPQDFCFMLFYLILVFTDESDVRKSSYVFMSLFSSAHHRKRKKSNDCLIWSIKLCVTEISVTADMPNIKVITFCCRCSSTHSICERLACCLSNKSHNFQFGGKYVKPLALLCQKKKERVFKEFKMKTCMLLKNSDVLFFLYT